MTYFDGETFDHERDEERLGKQLAAVRNLMIDGHWRSLSDIRWMINIASEAAISARLRDLRKARFGGYIVERRYVEKGIWEYRVSRPPR